MKKYELITDLEVNPAKSKHLVDEFLSNFEEWDKYEDEFINEEKVRMIRNKSKWNEAYLRKHISLLSTNFSKERLQHIKEVIEYLYPEEEIETESIFNKKKIILLIIILLIIFIILIVILLINLSKFFQHPKQNTANKINQEIIEKSAMKEMKKKQTQEVVKETNGTKEKNQTKVIEQNSTK